MTQAWTVRQGTVSQVYRDGRTLYVDHEARRAWIREGQPAWRNNNPGNVMGGRWARDHGAIGTDCNTMATFPDWETGRQAGIENLRTDGRYCAGNNTLSAEMAVWTNTVPGTARHTNYLNTVVNRLGAGVTGQTLMRNLIGRVVELIDAMRIAEGSQPGPRGQYEINYYQAAYYCYAPVAGCAYNMPCNEEWISEARRHFDLEGVFIEYQDPLVIDSDGNGASTISVEHGAHFDHDGNGFAEQTGWVASGDGLLAMDRNGDGLIDDAQELFGDQTVLPNGKKASNAFQVLAALDDHADGRVDSRDASYWKLVVWRDTDGDGYSEAGEVHRLDELGIAAIKGSRRGQGHTKGSHEGVTRRGQVLSLELIHGSCSGKGLSRYAENSFRRERQVNHPGKGWSANLFLAKPGLSLWLPAMGLARQIGCGFPSG